MAVFIENVPKRFGVNIPPKMPQTHSLHMPGGIYENIQLLMNYTESSIMTVRQ